MLSASTGWNVLISYLHACVSLRRIPIKTQKQVCPKLQQYDSMGPWSWNNRGHNADKRKAQLPAWLKQTISSPHSLAVDCRWSKSVSYFKPIPGLKSACQRQIGPIKSTEGPWHRRTTRPLSHTPHLSIYALHKFYWLRQVPAMIEIKLIVNWRAFLSAKEDTRIRAISERWSHR